MTMNKQALDPAAVPVAKPAGQWGFDSVMKLAPAFMNFANNMARGNRPSMPVDFSTGNLSEKLRYSHLLRQGITPMNMQAKMAAAMMLKSAGKERFLKIIPGWERFAAGAGNIAKGEAGATKNFLAGLNEVDNLHGNSFTRPKVVAPVAGAPAPAGGGFKKWVGRPLTTATITGGVGGLGNAAWQAAGNGGNTATDQMRSRQFNDAVSKNLGLRFGGTQGEYDLLGSLGDKGAIDAPTALAAGQQAVVGDDIVRGFGHTFGGPGKNWLANKALSLGGGVGNAIYGKVAPQAKALFGGAKPTTAVDKKGPMTLDDFAKMRSGTSQPPAAGAPAGGAPANGRPAY
jgi:hypothetical protein